MALIIKTLGIGNKTISGPQDLYTVPASKSALVTSARLVNVGANSASTSVMVRKSGGATDYYLTKCNYTTTAGASLVMEDPVTLGSGDKLRVDITGTTPSIDFQVNGVERDL